MRNLFIILLIFSMLLSFLPGCEKEEPELITSQEAKAAILELNPESIILECEYSEVSNAYIIDFKTFYATYSGVVNAYTGNIVSIVIKEEEVNAPMFAPAEEEVEDNSISPDTAMSIALTDSEAEGTAVIVQNEFDTENKVYNIIFRSGSDEYRYTIDAVTGEVITKDVVSES